MISAVVFAAIAWGAVALVLAVFGYIGYTFLLDGGR